MEDTEKEPTKEDCKKCCAISDVKIHRNGNYELTWICGKKEIIRK